MQYRMLQLLYWTGLVGLTGVAGLETNITRAVYDGMARLAGETEYSSVWWAERAECFTRLAPGLQNQLELAWAGMVEFWQAGGGPGDPWHRLYCCPESC